MGKYIMLIEVGKKQQYIFKSNRLAENVGASVMIKKITEEETQKYYKDINIDIIYEGGGNALYVFSSKAEGLAFAKSYSKHILKNYPGIVLYLVGYELQGEETVKDGISQCYRELAVKKSVRANSVRQIDYGKTVRCNSTNLPATNHGNVHLPADRANVPLSLESLEKYRNSSEFRQSMSNLCPEGFLFPLKNDELGRSEGDKSYVAIIHIDGNRMGEKIHKFNESHLRGEDETKEAFDKRYIKEFSVFSATIRRNYEEAFWEMCEIVANNMDMLREKLDLKENYLPVRPLILAGDDICFLADGRIGIELMRIFLNQLQKKTLYGITMHACGGAAIVKAHYPFSRAYELAEELCQNAKNHIKEEDASLIDWHIEQSELEEDLDLIRSHYITSDDALLYMRPYVVGEMKCVCHINHFLDALNIITNEENKVARSKVKGLREISKKGRTATKYYLQSNQVTEQLGRTNQLASDKEDSFILNDNKYHSLFFDAIEAMDLYIHLEETK